MICSSGAKPSGSRYEWRFKQRQCIIDILTSFFIRMNFGKKARIGSIFHAVGQYARLAVGNVRWTGRLLCISIKNWQCGPWGARFAGRKSLTSLTNDAAQVHLTVWCIFKAEKPPQTYCPGIGDLQRTQLQLTSLTTGYFAPSKRILL